jgi:hypothetical protein
LKKAPLHKVWLLTPFIGFCIFIIMYVVAAALYPGGSDEDKNAKGFSILHNYWCELLSDRAANGKYNPGGRVAIWAMGILCIALAVFWWITPRLFNPNRWYTICIGYAGILAMLITPFLSTKYHDLVINLASIPGITAMITTFVALYKNRWYKLFAFGIFSLMLIGLNNYVYYTGYWLYTLPVLQKVTFLLVMTWMSIITWLIYLTPPRYSSSSSTAYKHS